MATLSPERRAKIEAKVAILREKERRYKARIARFLENANKRGIRIVRVKQRG